MRRLLTYLLFLVPLLIAIEPPVMLAVTTKPSTDVETSPSTDPDTSAYTFHCPTNGECKFFDSEPPNTACTTEGWTATSGVDADMCDNRRFNGDGSDGDEHLTRTDFTGHTNSTTVELIFDIEYINDQGTNTNSAMVNMGTAASQSQCRIEMAIPNGLPESLRFAVEGSTTQLSNRFRSPRDRFGGTRLQFMMRYDAADGVCSFWADHFGSRPGTGALSSGTVTQTSEDGASQVFDTVFISNAAGNTNIIIRNFAWCAPGPCLL